MTPRFRVAPSRGFSLVEVLLAIVLLLALVGGLFTFIDGLRTGSQAADQRAAQMAAAEAVLDELEASLATTYVAGRDGVGGIVGDADHLNVRGRAWAYQPHATDVGGCDLRMDHEHLSARRVVGGDPKAWEAIRAVGGIRIRYHVGGEWKPAFDSAQAGELPAAVEISLWLGDGPGTGTPASASDTGVAVDATPPREADRVRVIAVHDAPPATGGGV